MKQLWFRAKRYGWGWYPVTWQGWTITLGYVGLIFLFASVVEKDATTEDLILIYFIPLILATGVFVGIAYKTGEKPRWRWGE